MRFWNSSQVSTEELDTSGMMAVFAVWDAKVEAYSAPFFARSFGEGQRMFDAAVTGGDSMLIKFPADYTLFKLGWFCPITGRFAQFETAREHGTALQAIARVRALQESVSDGQLSLVED